ncbi:MAG: MATE family efflux transporter [Tissierellia bacterium]|nr:MATE family efflux transporter [Tissierellia bacterium]
MDAQKRLLEGPIAGALFHLALPLMGIAFIEMTYGLVDTLWLGRLSTEAVSAVGAVHLFIWLAFSMVLISKTGLIVAVSQALGAQRREEAQRSMAAAYQVALFFATIMFIAFVFFSDELLSFYGLSPEVHKGASSYMRTIGVGMFFQFFLPVSSGVFVAQGDSRTSFRISGMGMVLNMILDPFFIFGWGPFPRLEVQGAAMATMLTMGLEAFLYFWTLYRHNSLFRTTNFLHISWSHIGDIFRLGIPACLQSMVHAVVGIILNRYIASFSSLYIAVYSVGAQIESVSWMSAEGFASAVSTFTGQNYGAKGYERIPAGFKVAMKIMSGITITAALVFFFKGESLYKLFVGSDMETVVRGGMYLKIISLSQFFMALETITSGILNGLGLTKYPSGVAAVFNVLRIPIARGLMVPLGITGIWWAISLSSIFKGLGIFLAYKILKGKTDGFRVNMDKYVQRSQKLA